MDMFCYQCEQTAKGIGCTVAGVCGKDAVTSAMQDLATRAGSRAPGSTHAMSIRVCGLRGPSYVLAGS